MIEKAITWFTINRKKIGYTLGGLNILSGLSLLGTSQASNGTLQIFVGAVIIFDAWSQP
jgi:hypothetical protein